FGKNCIARARSYLGILPDLRRRHRIFPASRARRVPAGLRRGPRFFSDDDVDLGSGRLRTLRDLELRAARFSLGAQSRVLVRRGLSRYWTERVLNCRPDALAKHSGL